MNDFYKFKNLSKFENLVHGISTREFGSMKNEDNTINRENLKKFLENLSLSKDVICMEQVHSGNVARVSNYDELLIKNTDGLVTNKKNVSLCVVTADCLPILFFDTQKQAIGLVHGGRRGLESGIIENMLGELVEQNGCDPKDIIVGIGPGIEKKCYEVDGEFLDIRKKAIDSLLMNGILIDNIENIEICTKDSTDLYSYRNGDKNNRFATVISLI